MRRTVRLGALVLGCWLLAACGADGDSGDAPGGGEGATLEEQVPPDEAEDGAADTPEAPEELEDPFEDFDRDEAESQAQSHLGLAEDEIEESSMVRIVRRGDEDYPVTMDLRPGRLNLELDDEGDGYVVTRVVVETPDDDELVIE